MSNSEVKTTQQELRYSDNTLAISPLIPRFNNTGGRNVSSLYERKVGRDFSSLYKREVGRDFIEFFSKRLIVAVFDISCSKFVIQMVRRNSGGL
jgi:hypothetical protein